MTNLLWLLANATVQGSACSTDCSTGLPTAGASTSNLQGLLQIVLGIFAVIAVLVIVIESFNFVISQGDPQKVAKARSTILYALVGLVVAVSAELIVTLVLGHL
jgi:hypothetical protein